MLKGIPEVRRYIEERIGLRCVRQSVYTWVSRGHIPVHHVEKFHSGTGHIYYVEESSVDRAWEQKRFPLDGDKRTEAEIVMLEIQKEFGLERVTDYRD